MLKLQLIRKLQNVQFSLKHFILGHERRYKMKRTFLVIILVGSLLLLCGCLSKEEIARRKAYDEDVYKARTIRYRCSYTEVWNALYSMIAEHFPIARESGCCGGDSNANEILKRVNKFLFYNKLSLCEEV